MHRSVPLARSRGLRCGPPLTIAIIAALAACGDENGTSDARIGPEGGEVRLGDFLLEIPPGALAEPTTITVSETTNADAPSPATSSEYRLGPEGLEFAIPAKIHLPSPDPYGAIVLVSPDEVADWSALPSMPEEERITAYIPHFSRYVAAERGSSPPCLFDYSTGEWNCTFQTSDGFIAVGISEWGDVGTQPKTIVSIRPVDPLEGHIQLLDVVVGPFEDLPYNVDPSHDGARDLGIQTPESSSGWLFELGSGIDDSQLPPEWQQHDRFEWPNDFQVWPEVEHSSMNYVVCVRYAVLNASGYMERSEAVYLPYHGPSLTETICDDDLDDDGDGYFDCADDDCADDPACAPSADPGFTMVVNGVPCSSYDSSWPAQYFEYRTDPSGLRLGLQGRCALESGAGDVELNCIVRPGDEGDYELDAESILGSDTQVYCRIEAPDQGQGTTYAPGGGTITVRHAGDRTTGEFAFEAGFPGGVGPVYVVESGTYAAIKWE